MGAAGRFLRETISMLFNSRAARVLMAVAMLMAISPGRSNGLAAGNPKVAAVLAGQLNGSCYIAAPPSCKLHVDALAVNVNPGQTLVGFELQANGQTIYAFRTDVSNPPGAGIYTASLPPLDFAARCGETYTLSLLARDSGDSGWLVTGQSAPVPCPQGRYDLFLPSVVR